MVKFIHSTGTPILFQFNSTDKLISNPDSLLEEADFFTDTKPRWNLKDVIKREAGLKNKKLHYKVILSGTNRQTNANTLITALSDNEFFTLNTESHQPRLDGTYAATGTLKQKENKSNNTLAVEFDTIEKEA